MTIHTLLQNNQYDKKVILEKLVCHTLGIKKEKLFTDIDHEITAEQEAWIAHAYTDYTVNEKPLEYILGWVEFLGHRFEVTPATLIPRPETEYMIEAVHEYIISTNASQKLTLLDIGTGCGVLGLSVLLHNAMRISQAYLTDLSTDALDVAKKNYRTYTSSIIGDPNMYFLSANLLDHEQLSTALNSGTSLIVANLPYIPEQLFEDNTDNMVKKWEPKMAFVGGDDGLDLYRVMFDQLIEIKKSSTTETLQESPLILFLEMMTRQVDILRQEYKDVFTFEEVKTFHFNIRIVKAKLV